MAKSDGTASNTQKSTSKKTCSTQKLTTPRSGMLLFTKMMRMRTPRMLASKAFLFRYDSQLNKRYHTTNSPPKIGMDRGINRNLVTTKLPLKKANRTPP